MQILKKYGPLSLILIIIIGICLFYAEQKSGLFIDEIYTYGLSNSHYAPFVTDICDGNMVDKTITRQEFLDYLTVGYGERFDVLSVYYNQSHDVHPPLYYWLINLISSFFPGEFSKWTGLVLNLVLYIITLIILFHLVLKLFDSRKNAVLAVILYGVSTIGLSTMLMIRMYMLLTLFTVLLAYLIAGIIKDNNRWLYPCVMITIFAGLMTQYYFVFYAFFICAAYNIYALIKKEYKSFVVFSAFALLGVMLMYLVYPVCLEHLFADKLVSGNTMYDNLFNISEYKRKLYTYIYSVNYEARVAVKVGEFACLGVLIKGKKVYAGLKNHSINLSSFVIILPAFFALVAVAISSPVIPLRYIYNIIPIFAVTVCFAIYLVSYAYADFSFIYYLKHMILLATLASAIIATLKVSPEFLYLEHTEYNAVTKKYSDCPCIYFDENYVSPITQDMLQLVNFDDIFVTNSADSSKLTAYINNHTCNTKAVVYIDVDKEWSSGFDSAKIIEAFLETTKYTRSELLYTYGSSEVYLCSY